MGESQAVRGPCSREPGRLFPPSRISSGTGSQSQRAAPSVTGGRAIAQAWPPAPPRPPRGQEPSALNRCLSSQHLGKSRPRPRAATLLEGVRVFFT